MGNHDHLLETKEITRRLLVQHPLCNLGSPVNLQEPHLSLATWDQCLCLTEAKDLKLVIETINSFKRGWLRWQGKEVSGSFFPLDHYITGLLCTSKDSPPPPRWPVKRMQVYEHRRFHMNSAYCNSLKHFYHLDSSKTWHQIKSASYFKCWKP